MLGTLVFLTPAGGLAALALVIPLAALVLVSQREQRGRKLLGLSAPPPTRQLPRVLALVAVPALLGLAATQPALRSTTKQRVRDGRAGVLRARHLALDAGEKSAWRPDTPLAGPGRRDPHA